MKKKENFISRIPIINPAIRWNFDKNKNVTIKIENKGVFNFLAQKLINKPRHSYIHLDETGSFIWTCIDDKRDIFEIGKYVKEKLGKKSEPLYERLSEYFKIMENYNLIKLR